MKIEAFLARVYTDEELRRAFLERPREVALAWGLPAGEADALADIDHDGIELAAASFQRKRDQRRS